MKISTSLPALTRPEPPWAELDTGIRETVRALWDAGFEPTDSGDGQRLGAKADMECVLDVPHVFCVVAPRDLVREADRLHRLAAQLLIEPAIAGAPLVEAWYSPGDGVATLALFGRLPREVGA